MIIMIENDRNYLEYGEKYGYASINLFSKLILNKPFNTDNCTFINFTENKFFIQIHIY